MTDPSKLIDLIDGGFHTSDEADVERAQAALRELAEVVEWPDDANVVSVTLKDPDGVWDSLDDANLIEGDALFGGRKIREDAEPHVQRWIEFHEYVTIEINLDTGAARVRPVRS